MGFAQRMVTVLAFGLCAAQAQAAELVVFSAAAMKGALADLPARFAGETGDRVRLVFGTAGSIRDKAVAGDAFDLVIVPPAPLADLVRRGLVAGGTGQELGAVRLGAAVGRGQAHPPIGTPADFKAAMLAAGSIGMADPATGATSGIYLARLLEQLGIAETLRPRLRFYPEGQVAMEAAARGEVTLGLGQISEIVPVAGVELVGPIPDSLQLRTVYAAGLATAPAAPAAARRLLEYLASPPARAALAAQGFEAP